MEYKDPMFELLSSLEQTIFKDISQTATLPQKTNPSTESEQPRRGAGLKTDDLARVMGVTVVMVHEWESERVKPSTTELKLMCLIQVDPRSGKQLMD